MGAEQGVSALDVASEQQSTGTGHRAASVGFIS